MYLPLIQRKKGSTDLTRLSSGWTHIVKRLGGKGGAGVPGYGVRGAGLRGPVVSGKHGVWWKTRGVENTGSHWKTRDQSAKHGGNIISPNNKVEILLFHIAMRINRREMRFLLQKSELNIS